MSAPQGKFSLGAIEILPAAQQALRQAGQPAAALLYKHQYETPDDLIGAASVVSTFQLASGGVIYVITDEARQHTVVMTAQDARPDRNQA